MKDGRDGKDLEDVRDTEDGKEHGRVSALGEGCAPDAGRGWAMRDGWTDSLSAGGSAPCHGLGFVAAVTVRAGAWSATVLILGKAAPT